MPDETPAPSPRDIHIAARKAQLREEIRAFGNTAKVTTVEAEKAEAEVRVEVAQALLKTLDALS